jgi:hypothetical protein
MVGYNNEGATFAAPSSKVVREIKRYATALPICLR